MNLAVMKRGLIKPRLDSAPYKIMMEPINDRTMPYRRFETSDMEFNSVFNEC